MAGLLWPLVLQHGDVTLRPLARSDRSDWLEVRAANADWLRPWDSTNPSGAKATPRFADVLRGSRRQAREGHSLPMAIEFGGRFVGQVTLGNIVWGSLRQGYIGYWIDSRVAGRGIVTTAVAMITDHALLDMELHRLEINIRPENKPSIRVVEKLSFTFEGLRPRYLHIDGDWRDHHCYVMTSEELPAGGLTRRRPTSH
jgi:ribosomal-protein-alanine N-acetyltransferase